MHQIWNSKAFKCLALILILITCTSCKAFKPYKVSDYLIDLAYQSGISLSQEKEESFKCLKEWNVIDDNDYLRLDDDLDYEFLYKTIYKLIESDDIDNTLNKWIKPRGNKELIDKDEASGVINKAVDYINNPVINNKFEYDDTNTKYLDDYYLDEDYLEYKDNLEIGDIVYLEDDNEYKKIVDHKDNYYIVENPLIEDVFNQLNIQGTSEIDFTDSLIIPYGDEEDEKTSYVNKNYTLLASNRKTFNTNGFRVAYSFTPSSLNVRISKSEKDKANIFFDMSLSNLKPTYKWKSKKNNVENAFLKINYKLTNELGLSTGKYKRYYLDFKDIDASSFSSLVKSTIKPKDDEVECTIPICQIKTPIPNVPLANFNIDVVAKIYVTGRVELVVYNSGIIGFESKNGNFRVIHDVNTDADFIVGGSSRAVAGLNFNLEAAEYRLMDVELDAGARAAVTSTLHLYDSDGIDNKEESDIPYAILQEVSKENNDVRVCGDVSLNWVLDLQLNTSKSLLYKYGLTYKKSILDSNNQIFNNLTHIENWQLVKKCTRKNRQIIQTPISTDLNSDKIVLSKYSSVVVKGNGLEIPIVSLPKNYSTSDLIINADTNNIVSIDGLLITALNIGSTKIEIKTNDDKYKAYLNILVSTG